MNIEPSRRLLYKNIDISKYHTHLRYELPRVIVHSVSTPVFACNNLNRLIQHEVPERYNCSNANITDKRDTEFIYK